MRRSKMTAAKLVDMVRLWQKTTKPVIAKRLGICMPTLYEWRKLLIKQDPRIREELTVVRDNSKIAKRAIKLLCEDPNFRFKMGKKDGFTYREPE